jgi:D-alanyl-D-alanine dipeptidase
MALNCTRRVVFFATCLLLADVAAVTAEAPAGPPKGCGPCFVGEAVYPEARAFLQRPAAEALLSAHRWLKEQGFGLVIYDAYRPWSVTKLFWDITPPDKRVFVADPSTGSVHNRGCAVDFGLFDLRTGRIVEMPGAYDEMTERSFVTYTGATTDQRARRDLLRRAMEQDGYFFVLPIEDIPFSAIR